MYKTKLGYLMDLFSKITTFSFIFSSIYILIFAGMEENFSIRYIWGILGESFVLAAAYLPLITEKELSKTRYLIYNILYFLFANVVVLGFGLYMGWFSLKRPETIIAMELNFLLVFTTVWAVMYFSAKSSVNKMNEQLKKMKQM